MSRDRPPQQNQRLLQVLTDGDVVFAVIGGVAALLHGASQMTVDLDVAAPFDETNLGRLRAALAPFSPMHATRPDLSVLDESMERLLQFRLLLIETKLGRLVLARDDLIRVKRTVARPKDILVALELEAARERDGGE
jgi:hypothetical protein